MKRLTFLALSLSLAAASGVQAQDAGLKTEEQKTLYALGVAIGRNIADLTLTPAQMKYVTMGLRDSAQNPPKLKVDLKEYGPKLNEFVQIRKGAAQAREVAKSVGEKEKAKGFLEKAAKEKGAVVTPSGLVYLSLQDGKGTSPKETDVVKVHYKGTLIDGKVFDSSLERGSPAEFPLNRVIPCWTEGVQKMKVGGKAKLVCPSSIAYGDQGQPPTIPGGATLVFEVQLLDISKAPSGMDAR